VTEPGFLLDANICAYLLSGAAPLLRARIEERAEGEVVTSAVACAEVLVGAARREGFDATLQFFRAFPVLPFDEKASRIYASLPFRRGGFDRLIAAHAMSLDLTLVTNNERDFADIQGLRVENWTI